MKTEHFSVIYDGPALAVNEVDVNTLAPALLAIGELLESATYAMNGEKVKPQINVRGNFKSGSFGIDFTLATDWAKGIVDFFAGDKASATANAIAILTAVGLAYKAGTVSLISLIKWVNGRKLTRVDLSESTAIIHVNDDSITVSRNVLELYRDIRTRQALEKALQPLQTDGIDSFAATHDGNHFVSIDHTELPVMAAPAEEDVLLIDETRKMAFSIVSLAFKEDNKWRLHDGQAVISAIIDDAAFLDRINKSMVSFSKGDVLVCMVAVRQWKTGNGTRTEYTVKQVIDHILAGKQASLPLS